MKAIWNNEILANSSETIMVEGNHYFPPASLNMEFFKKSEKSRALLFVLIGLYVVRIPI